MNTYLLIAIAIIVFVLMLGVAWLWYQYQNLKRDYIALLEQSRRNNQDVAGLCSAALALDEHLLRNDRQLYQLTEQFNEWQYLAEQTRQSFVPPVSPSVKPTTQANFSSAKQPKEPVGYENVIQKIRLGVGIEELVKECGLTRDEALLLSRLHGGK